MALPSPVHSKSGYACGQLGSVQSVSPLVFVCVVTVLFTVLCSVLYCLITYCVLYCLITYCVLYCLIILMHCLITYCVLYCLIILMSLHMYIHVVSMYGRVLCM